MCMFTSASSSLSYCPITQSFIHNKIFVFALFPNITPVCKNLAKAQAKHKTFQNYLNKTKWFCQEGGCPSTCTFMFMLGRSVGTGLLHSASSCFSFSNASSNAEKDKHQHLTNKYHCVVNLLLVLFLNANSKVFEVGVKKTKQSKLLAQSSI